METPDRDEPAARVRHLLNAPGDVTPGDVALVRPELRCDWPVGDMRESPETMARLAALDDPAVLYGLAALTLRDSAPAPWYLEPVCDRLSPADLARLTAEAVRARGSGPNGAAGNVVAYVALHEPLALIPYLGQLWDISRSSRSFDAPWPWRAADEPEIERLMDIARGPDTPDARFAKACLLQTRRPDVLARIEADQYDLEYVGYRRNDDGTLTRLHPEPVWHVAYPRPVLEEWAARHPVRIGQPSWPEPDGGPGRHAVSGFTGQACPHCGQSLHRLLRLDPVPAGLGITTRDRVEFTWCPGCTPYASRWHTSHAADGAPADVIADFVVTPPGPDPEDSWAEWLIPESKVGLVPLGDRWRRQDWCQANARENLHRVGGEPTWIQNPDYADCPGCARTLRFAAQIAVEDLWAGEGLCYLLWCDPCATSAVIYQQT